jgi:Suppressor of fused protein (SUFU)
VIDVLAKVRAHLREHFAGAGITSEPDEASVTFLGTERIDVLRFGPDDSGLSHYVSLGCSRHPMFDPAEMVTDALHGPRAEVVVALRGPPPAGLARSIAIVAAAPAVEGLILEPDALIDLESPLWDLPSPPALRAGGPTACEGSAPSAPAPKGAPFTAFLLGRSDIDDVPLTAPLPPVTVLSATPITATEAAWVRLKGADAMREAWDQDRVDVFDPSRPAVRPT